MSASDTSSQPPDVLKEQRIRSQIRAAKAQVTVAAVSVIAVCVAIWVAAQGQLTVIRNNEAALRQSEEAELSTAITALGSSEPAERIAGLLLLGRNTSDRFALSAKTDEAPANVFGDYTTALQILSGYLSSSGNSFLADASTGQVTARFARGYGKPPPPGMPLDITYAADQVRYLMEMRSEVAGLEAGQPAIDLSNDELFGQPWHGINFGWVTAYMPGIDLRGADLSSSQWSKNSDLARSYLQCADLQGAVFRGVNLNYADLRGANVQGADFRGAHFKGAKITDLYGIARWPRRLQGTTTLPVAKWNRAACLRYGRLWDNRSASASAPAPVRSAQVGSPPTPGPSPSKGK